MKFVTLLLFTSLGTAEYIRMYFDYIAQPYANKAYRQ